MSSATGTSPELAAAAWRWTRCRSPTSEPGPPAGDAGAAFEADRRLALGARQTYVAATGWPQESSPFTSTAQRVAADPAWAYHEWDTRHDVMHDGPQRVLELLLTI